MGFMATTTTTPHHNHHHHYRLGNASSSCSNNNIQNVVVPPSSLANSSTGDGLQPGAALLQAEQHWCSCVPKSTSISLQDCRLLRLVLVKRDHDRYSYLSSDGGRADPPRRPEQRPRHLHTPKRTNNNMFRDHNTILLQTRPIGFMSKQGGGVGWNHHHNTRRRTTTMTSREGGGGGGPARKDDATSVAAAAMHNCDPCLQLYDNGPRFQDEGHALVQLVSVLFLFNLGLAYDSRTMERTNNAETVVVGPPPAAAAAAAAAAQEEEPERHVMAVPMVLVRNESKTGVGPRVRSIIPSTTQ